MAFYARFAEKVEKSVISKSDFSTRPTSRSRFDLVETGSELYRNAMFTQKCLSSSQFAAVCCRI